MLVDTREKFDKALAEISAADVIVADVETNGLKPYNGSVIIGISVYVPATDFNAYIPFRHGVGRIEVEYTGENTATKSFAQMSWTGNTKRSIYMNYWWSKFVNERGDTFCNLPLEWESELKAVLFREGQTAIFHNALFDLACFYVGGYRTPDTIVDTLVGLHLVHEDMNGIQVNAPYTDSNGNWVRIDGQLVKKLQYANKELKWFSAYLGFEGATEGEEGLTQAASRLTHALVDYVCENIADPHNEGLVYANIRDNKANAWDKYGSQQRERFYKKLEVNEKANMWMLSATDVAPYALLDTRLTYQLYCWIKDTLTSWDNLDLWSNQNETLLKLTHHMERSGIRLDVKTARQELERLGHLADELQEIMRQYTAEDFNPSSPAQLITWLPIVLKQSDIAMPSWWGADMRDNDTYDVERIPDTKKETLERYIRHPFVRMVLEYRKATKGATTYLTNWIKCRDGNSVIHPRFSVTGTVSGRLSSSGDAGNFQNIPERNGFTIKRSLKPYNDKWVFFNVDYGQLELRLASWIAEVVLELDSGRRTMTTLFENDVDMHAHTRDSINVRNIVYPDMNDDEIVRRLGYSFEDDKADTPEKRAGIVSDRCRYIAKTMNFGLLYGGGGGMLSKLLKIDIDTAAVLVQNWRGLYPAFPRANEYYTREALTWRRIPDGSRDGLYVTQPISGRHRRFDRYPTEKVFFNEYGVKQIYDERAQEARKSFNNIVQGLGGYIMNTSAVKIRQMYGEDVLRYYAVIHDSGDAFIHEDHLYIAKDIVRIMTDWDVRPRLTVDFEGGLDNWQDVRKIDDLDLWIESKATSGYKKEKKK